jgi:hypothetical protein
MKYFIKLFILPTIIGILFMGGIFYLITGSYKHKEKYLKPKPQYIEYSQYHRQHRVNNYTDTVEINDYTEEDSILSIY